MSAAQRSQRWHRVPPDLPETPPRSTPLPPPRAPKPSAGPFSHAARDEVRSLQRKHRRVPALRQARQRMPGLVVRGRIRSRPGEQHTVGEMLRAQAIEQRARRLLASRRRNLAPMLGHRGEPLVLGIGEPQFLPQPLGVLGDRDRKRAEPAHRIGRQTRSPLRPWPYSRRSRDTATPPSTRSSKPESAMAIIVGTACGATTSFISLHAHALARELVEPVAAGDAGSQALPRRDGRHRYRRRGNGRNAGCANNLPRSAFADCR